MTYQERFHELKEFAIHLMMQHGERVISLSPADVEQFAEKYQRYIDELPEELKEREVGFLSPQGNKIVKRKDIPSLIKQDLDFAMRLLKALAGG